MRNEYWCRVNPETGELNNPAETMRLDPQLGWMPAIPEPYWLRTWFQTRPMCLQCKEVFKNRQEWDNHYVLTHCEAERGETV